MVRDFYLDREARNQYLSLMVNTLIDKYLVNRPRLARAIEMNTTYFADFVDGRRSYISDESLDKIEMLINDLYEPIIKDEIEMNRSYFLELSKESKKRDRQLAKLK